MIQEMVNAYQAARKEAEEHRKAMREVEVQHEYIKLQSEAVKLVADMKKLGITADDIKSVIGKPF